MKNIQKIIVVSAIILLCGVFSCQNVNSPDAEYSVTVSGIVTRLNDAPLDSAVIILSNPFRRDTTKSDGTFSYSFTTTEKNQVTTTLKISHQNFYDTTFSVSYGSDSKSISLGQVKLKGLTGAVDSIVTGKPSARAGVIVFVKSTYSIISIRNAGPNDATNLTFEVRDTTGVPVDEKNKTAVQFKFIQQPDSLTQLSSNTASTNSAGQVSILLIAGQTSGIAQIEAFAAVKNAVDTTKFDTIQSQIVSVPIAGGLPDPSRFTISSQKLNIPGGVKFNLRNTISAIVGDAFGNPVQSGTIVYFSTNGGIIQPSAKTSTDGSVSVDLITGNPLPPNGVATVVAQVGTSGAAKIGGSNPPSQPGAVNNSSQKEDLYSSDKVVDKKLLIKNLRKPSNKNKTIERVTTVQGGTPNSVSSVSALFSKSLNILFSGSPQISSTDSTFVVPGLGTKVINFKVSDEHGNPLSEGTTISVSSIGLDTTGAILSGDLNKTLPDTYDTSYTKFAVSIKDHRTSNTNQSVPVSLTIEVTGPNGNIKKTFQGVLASAGSDSGKVGSIVLVNPNEDSVVVNGGGTPTSVQFSVKVFDALGVASPDIPVTFVLTNKVDGGEYLSKVIAVTDQNGIATTQFNSGIKKGRVQIVASVSNNSSTISSNPKTILIKTGPLASINLLSISNSSLSVKGGGGLENSTIVFEGRDSLGNPIDGANQSQIQFSILGDTAGATLNPTVALTDPNTGRATINLTAGTQAGIIKVIAQSGTAISSSTQISVSGGLPSQSRFGISVAKKNYSILSDKQTVISVSAGDKYGNPAKPGSIISFQSNGGLIDANSTLNSTGSASANLQFVNPQPPSGIATITAKTFGDNNSNVLDSVSFVLSQEAIISDVGSSLANFSIEDGLSKTFQYSVADINGNPLAQGNSISVTSYGTAASSVTLTGDIAVTLPDTKLSGTGSTIFSFTARDTIKNDGKGPQPLGFKISVTGPNSNGTTLKSFDGTLQGGSGNGNEGSVASIIFKSKSTDTLVVANVGSPQTDTISFIVRDINQNPIKNAAVQFAFSQSSNSSEFLSPSYMNSDDSGQVTVVLHSGTKSGQLKVNAQVVAGSSVIKSSDVPVYVKTGPLATIAFISQSRTELSVTGVGGEDNATFVFEGRDVLGNSLDFANQTQIQFKIIGGGSGYGDTISPSIVYTDPTSGRAQATLTSGRRATVLQIIAQNISGTIKSTPITMVIHGGYPVAESFLFQNSSIILSNNNPISISMQLGDKYGNPVKAGTAVYFSSTPTTGIITAQSFSTDLGFVNSTFYPLTNPVAGVITAKTVGEYGDTLTKTLSVSISSSSGSINPSSQEPSQIVFIGNTSSSIYVKGVGASEATTLTYEVRDSVGSPINLAHRVGVNFSLSFFPNSYTSGGTAPTLLPNVDSTDDQGRVSVTVLSGTQAGVVQLVATLTTSTQTIVSQPTKISVYSGFADQSHFTISAANYNFPGLQRAFSPSLSVSVGIADKYSNPVAPGTQVYFHSSHGTITGGAPTNSGGFTSATLTPGNPYPNAPDTLPGLAAGYGRVYAQTIGKDGALISDSILVLWTGAPIITNTGGNTFTVANGGTSGAFTFSVVDKYGHPLSAGTTIKVTSTVGAVTGITNTTLYDTFSTGAGITTFSVILKDDNNTDTDPPASGEIDVTVTHPIYGTYTLVLATGTVD